MARVQLSELVSPLLPCAVHAALAGVTPTTPDSTIAATTMPTPTLIDVFIDFTLLLSRWLYPSSILEAAKGRAQIHHDHSAAARAPNAATTPRHHAAL